MTDKPKPTPLEIFESNMLYLSLSSNPTLFWAWKEITKQGEEVCLMNERLNDMNERWENDQNTIKTLKSQVSNINLEAIHLLREMVLYIADGEISDTTPKHDCEYKTNPEKGHCRFCEDWSDAVEMVFPQEDQEETQ